MIHGIQKAPRPSRLRNRLALAFGIFALTIVTALGIVVAWIWESMHAANPASIMGVLLTAGVGVVAVAALVGYLIAGPLARPMEMWARAADRIGLGERDVSFPTGGGSHELARVSAALQSMFARLSEKEDLLQERIRERTSALLEATDALSAERERLAEALQGSRLAFWDLDLESGEIRLSSEWARMLGEGDGETVTTVKELLTRVPEEEHESISQSVFAALKDSEGQYDIDHRMRRADGSWMWIRSRGRVVARAPNGRALRMVGTNADVAARKEQEDRQRRNEEHLRKVLDGVASGICHVDLKGRILFANRRYHEFYGLAEGSAAGQVIRDIAGDDGAAAFERCLPQLLAGTEVQYEREARAQGRKVLIDVRMVPHRDANGVTEGAYVVLTEVTGRRLGG
jgi:PAS domain S-box-containing protein